jgi:hypothetical protein
LGTRCWSLSAQPRRCRWRTTRRACRTWREHGRRVKISAAPSAWRLKTGSVVLWSLGARLWRGERQSGRRHAPSQNDPLEKREGAQSGGCCWRRTTAHRAAAVRALLRCCTCTAALRYVYRCAAVRALLRVVRALLRCCTCPAALLYVHFSAAAGGRGGLKARAFPPRRTESVQSDPPCRDSLLSVELSDPDS